MKTWAGAIGEANSAGERGRQARLTWEATRLAQQYGVRLQGPQHLLWPAYTHKSWRRIAGWWAYPPTDYLTQQAMLGSV